MVKMNVGEPKVSEVQGVVVHDLLEVRLRVIVYYYNTIALDYKEQENNLEK